MVLFLRENNDKFNIYVKNIGLMPSEIGAHAQYMHMHLYSVLGESLCNMYVREEGISVDIDLEKNTGYYIVFHSGLSDAFGCSESISIGNYVFSVFSHKNYSKYCIHEYSQSLILPTYFEKGYQLHVCEICGYTYKDNYSIKKVLDQGYLYSACCTGKGKMYLYWSTVSDATGYQIRYSTDKSFKTGVVTKNVSGQSSSSKAISKLSRKKKYYVQLRAYIKSGGKTAYGKWSAKMALKTK